MDYEDLLPKGYENWENSKKLGERLKALKVGDERTRLRIFLSRMKKHGCIRGTKWFVEEKHYPRWNGDLFSDLVRWEQYGFLEFKFRKGIYEVRIVDGFEELEKML